MKLIEFKNRDLLIDQAIKEITSELRRVDSKKHAVMLSGGSTPLVIYRKITEKPFEADNNAVITYSDERFVPITSKENNYQNTTNMVEALQLKAEQVVRVKTELGFEESAEAFHQDLDLLLQEGGIPLGFLGMGTDGHTASLFSLENVAEGEGKWAIPVKKVSPPDRISVSKSLLHRVQKIVLLLTGQEKQPMLKTLLENPQTIPAGLALSDHQNVEIWYAD